MTGNRARIIELSWPFWRAEFEIGFSAFSHEGIYRDAGWLAAQCWKERTGSGVYGPAGSELEDISPDDPVAQEERVHFELLRGLGAIMEEVLPDWHPGPAAQALVARRNSLWENPAARHGVRMSEGGGLGLFHGANAAIAARDASRPQDGAVRSVLARIIADEAGHIASAMNEFEAASLAPDDVETALSALADCLSLKVRERSEQFAAQLAHAGRNSSPEQCVAQYRADIRAQLGALHA